MSSRVRNICFKHGLIRSGGPRELDFQLVPANISEVTDFITRIRTSDLVAGPDCPAKLYDMAMTAVELYKRSHSPDGSGRSSRPAGTSLSDFQQGLISVAYKTLGWLAAVGRAISSVESQADSCTRLSATIQSFRRI